MAATTKRKEAEGAEGDRGYFTAWWLTGLPPAVTRTSLATRCVYVPKWGAGLYEMWICFWFLTTHV